MPRPRHCRFVQGGPTADYYKPRAVPLRELEEVRLSVEGLEALRLADLEGLTAKEAADRMRVSRFTFGRVLAEARRTVADALTRGKALRIEGGHYEILKPERVNTMKNIAVSSEGPGLDDMVDPRFGRTGGFVILDIDSGRVRYLDNGASQTLAQGAGIATVERLAEAGVEVVLSGYIGPKAFEALEAADIKAVQNMDNMSVSQALDQFKSGQIRFAEAPNKI